MMKRTPFIQQPMMGVKRNWIEYEAVTPSPFWCIWFMGMTEITGPADGSQLGELEKYGPGFHAKNGFDYPFNLIIPQGVKSIGEFMGILLEYLQQEKGCTEGQVFMWGHSRGGREVDNYLSGFQGRKTLGLVKFFIPIAGQYTADAAFTFCGCVDAPVLCVHSKADQAIAFIYSEQLVNGLNRCPGRKHIARLEQLGTLNHMETAYWATSTADDNPVYKFILDQLYPVATPQPEPILADYVLNGDRITETSSGKYKSLLIKI